ncbi:hypothetical protein DPEC_G00125780 [Dallia pectoralis]|uniref:Uncharacterized protein n=1 Tax=Dallia pectoralis TaxID=75939 RepID=A0ACC2GS20_DALPE|nr:hypothetical protein DPEC_G00125780 [Dallia pectoralis]
MAHIRGCSPKNLKKRRQRLTSDGDDMPARRKRRAPKALLASSEEETDIEGDVLPPTPPEAFVSKKVWGAGEARTKNKVSD